MNVPLLVRRFQGFGDLEWDLQSFFEGDGALGYALFQSLPFDEFQDDDLGSVPFLQSIDGPDSDGSE